MKSHLQKAKEDPAFIDLLERMRQSANYFMVGTECNLDKEHALELCITEAYLAGKQAGS
jgi:hypothetical protein